MNRRALLAAAAFLPAVARAQAPEVLALAGQPVVALAAHPTVGPRLRRMAAGRQRVVSDALRGPGPGLAVSEGRWISGHACAPTGCGEAKVFLAFDTQTESVVIMLLEHDRPSLFIPPRIAIWPKALQPALVEFDPGMAGALRYGD